MAAAEHDVEAHSTVLTSIRFSRASGQLVASGSRDGVVRIWVTGAPEPLMTITGHKSEVSVLAFDEGEEHLMVGFVNGCVQVWDLARNGQLVRDIEGVRSSPVGALAFFPTSTALPLPRLVALWRGMNVSVVDLETMATLRTFSSRTVKESLPNSRCLLHFSPCGRWLLAASDSCPMLTVWNVTSGEVYFDVAVDSDDGVTCFEFHPQRLLVALGTQKGVFYQLSLPSKAIERAANGPRGKISRICFSPSGDVCYGIVADGVYVLDAAVKELVGNVMSAHWRGVSDVFVLDTHLLVYTREKRHLQLWMCDLQALAVPQDREPSEDDVIEAMLRESYEQCHVLTSRITNIRLAHAFLSKGKIKDAMEHVGNLQDAAVAHDVVNQGLVKHLDQDTLRSLKPTELAAITAQLRLLLGSELDIHVEAAMRSILHLVRALGTGAKSGALHECVGALKRQCISLSGSTKLSAGARDLARQIQAM